MPQKYFQSGFIPVNLLVIIIIIAVASTVVIKNLPLNQSQPTPDKSFQVNSSAQIKSNPSPTITGKQAIKNITPTTTQQTSPTPTNSSNNSTTITTTPIPTTSYGTVKGTVKLLQSSGTPLPLSGVSVNLTCDNCNKLYNGNVHATNTDSNGNFIFNSVPPFIDIKLIAIVYANGTNPININLTAGQTITQDISVTLPSPTPTLNNYSVKLTYPNGGETIKIGDTIHIAWEAAGTFNTFILSGTDIYNGNETGFNIGSTTDSNARSMDWVVDIGNAITPRQAKFSIIANKWPRYVGDETATQKTDSSDNYFTITR